MILQVKHLTKNFGELYACDDISFEVQKGEIFGIAGPNGAGKTTLFNCIAGVYHCGGEILFEGANINGMRPHMICKSGIGRTFQIPVIFHTLNVKENVSVGAYFGSMSRRKNVRKQIDDAIEIVGLDGKENEPGESVNLFEKKMTMLAAVLATEPKLLLLDEPMSGLSASEIDAFSRLIKRINRELQLTVVIIEHLMKVLTGLSNRLMILDNGKRFRVGDPETVCNDKEVIEIYLGAVDSR